MKYTIVLDKLHLQLAGQIDGLKQGPLSWNEQEAGLAYVNKRLKRKDIFLEPIISYQKNYLACYKINHNCRSVAILNYMSGDKKRFTHKRTSVIEIEKAVLYSEDFRNIIDKVIKALDFTIRKIHRIEIAVDGVGIMDLADSIFLSKKWTTLNHRYKLEVHPRKVNNQKADGYCYGNPRGRKYFSIYPKGKRKNIIQDPFIKYFWQDNGFDPEKMERCELALWSKINDFSLQPNDWTTEYLAEYFRLHSENNLMFVKGAAKRKRRIPLLDFETFPKSLNKVTFVSKKRTNNAVAVKSTLRFLFREMDNFGADYTACLEAYNAIVKMYELHRYVLDYEKKWREELRRENRPKSPREK